LRYIRPELGYRNDEKKNVGRNLHNGDLAVFAADEALSLQQGQG